MRYPEAGSYVIPVAGHDAGRVHLVLGYEPERGTALIADGKRRTQAAPKRKKLKHLILLDVPKALPDEMGSNKAIREAIKMTKNALQ